MHFILDTPGAVAAVPQKPPPYSAGHLPVMETQTIRTGAACVRSALKMETQTTRKGAACVGSALEMETQTTRKGAACVRSA